MTEIYGHKWASNFGAIPNRAWSTLVNNLGRDRVRHGLNRLLNSTDPWPPTAIQFRQLCTDYDPGAWERQCHKPMLTTALEDLTAKERRCRENLKHLKNLRAEVGL